MENQAFLDYGWTGADSPVMVKPQQIGMETRLATLEERSLWHRNIGWGVAGFLGTALLLLVSWWIPRELASLRESVKADGASQLEPIKIDLARMNALLQLKESKSVPEAIRLGVDFSQPKYAIGAVKAIAEQAKASNIETSASVLIGVNERIKEAVEQYPALLDPGWSTRLSLVDYRSSLPLDKTQVNSSPPVLTSRLTLVDGGRFDGNARGRQKLDGVHWRNFTFTNMLIEYDGGPMVLENVTFINCTFEMRYSIRSGKVQDMLLAQNPVTGSFA
jgi:hypothetical protein